MSWTNIENKEKIVEQYIPLVKYIASRIMIGRSTYIEYEDLVSYGMIGLMDAISKFDPDKGIKFSSYASIRIKGEMIDQIRKARPISKGAMDKLAKYNEAIDALQNRLLREPIIDEIAEYLNITVSEVADIERYINFMSVVSLEGILFSEDDELTVMGVVEDKNSPSPHDSYEDKEKVEILAECIEKLKEKDRTILNLYYYEGLTLKEIGKVLEVSESRVCQLHSRAIKNLRVMLQKINYREVSKVIHILLRVIGIVLLVVNRDIKNERADDGGSFANILKNEEKEFTDYDMKFVDMRKDMAESILDLQKEIQELRTEVFNIENSNVNIKENIKQVKLDNDIKRDCIDKDIISEINFNNLKDNHGNDSKFENIKMMIDEGKSDEEICSSLSIGKGEVLLVRGLYNQ